MKFNYQARTKEGEIQSGVVESSSAEVALDVLQKYGLFITFLEEIKPRPFIFRKPVFLTKTSYKDIVLFSRQMSIMLESNIPLADALETLALQTKKEDFKEKIFKISQKVRAGTSLSRTLSVYPQLFSTFYINMIKSGEVSGELPKVLTYLANHLEREYHLRSKTKGAMIYPAFVLFAAIVIFLLMMYVIIPKLTNILMETGAELPGITLAFISISKFLTIWGWLVFLAIFFIILLIYRYSKTKKGREIYDKISLRLPLIGGLFKNIYLSRFAENLSTLIAAGIPIAQALDITGNIIGNSVYRKVIAQTKDMVTRGETISSTLERFPDVIPPLFSQMTSVGEKTGRLDTSLKNIVDFYKREVDVFIDALVSMIEPILIIFLGAMVAILAAALFIPLYQVGTGL